jgi:hypothetical protein
MEDHTVIVYEQRFGAYEFERALDVNRTIVRYRMAEQLYEIFLRQEPGYSVAAKIEEVIEYEEAFHCYVFRSRATVTHIRTEVAKLQSLPQSPIPVPPEPVKESWLKRLARGCRRMKADNG